MKEYIDKTIFNASGLTIGFNKTRTSLIFGQNDEWVVLDPEDILKIKKSLQQNKEAAIFDGFNFSLQQKGIILNQQNNSVYVHRDVFGKLDKS